MYKKSVRRRRAVLALLVSLSIALLTVYFGESASGGLHAVQRGFLEVLAPLQEGANRALKPARDLVGWTGDVFDAKSENEDLRKQNEELRRQVAALQTAERDARQLRALVGLQPLQPLPGRLRPGGRARDRPLARRCGTRRSRSTRARAPACAPTSRSSAVPGSWAACPTCPVAPRA